MTEKQSTMNIYLKNWTADRVKTVIIGLLAGLMVVELIWAGMVLFSAGEHEIVQTLPATATLALEPEEYIVGGGEEFTLDIVLHTNGRQVSGVDAVISYDPARLELITPVASVAARATSAALFDVYPANSVDEVAGEIRLSAIQNPGGVFNGSGTLGRLTFRPVGVSREPGETSVTFLYTKDARDDSNVMDAKTSDDILGQVVNAEITIQ